VEEVGPEAATGVSLVGMTGNAGEGVLRSRRGKKVGTRRLGE